MLQAVGRRRSASVAGVTAEIARSPIQALWVGSLSLSSPHVPRHPPAEEAEDDAAHAECDDQEHSNRDERYHPEIIALIGRGQSWFPLGFRRGEHRVDIGTIARSV
jgi:hypothetical protein